MERQRSGEGGARCYSAMAVEGGHVSAGAVQSWLQLDGVVLKRWWSWWRNGLRTSPEEHAGRRARLGHAALAYGLSRWIFELETKGAGDVGDWPAEVVLVKDSQTLLQPAKGRDQRPKDHTMRARECESVRSVRSVREGDRREGREGLIGGAG